jgi:hypothetical protein
MTRHDRFGGLPTKTMLLDHSKAMQKNEAWHAKKDDSHQEFI